jgi:hypothetical protein
MKPSAKVILLLGFIDEVIGVGGNYHRRFIIFVLLFVLSSRRNFEIPTRKKRSTGSI